MKFTILFSMVSAMFAFEASAVPSNIEVQVKRQAASGTIEPSGINASGIIDGPSGIHASGIIDVPSGIHASGVISSSVLYPTATAYPGGPGFLLICYPQYGNTYPAPTGSAVPYPIGSGVPSSGDIGNGTVILTPTGIGSGNGTISTSYRPAPSGNVTTTYRPGPSGNGTVSTSYRPGPSNIPYPTPLPVAPYHCYPYYGGDNNSTIPVFPTANATSIAFADPTVAATPA